MHTATVTFLTWTPEPSIYDSIDTSMATTVADTHPDGPGRYYEPGGEGTVYIWKKLLCKYNDGSFAECRFCEIGEAQLANTTRRDKHCNTNTVSSSFCFEFQFTLISKLLWFAKTEWHLSVIRPTIWQGTSHDPLVRRQWKQDMRSILALHLYSN